MFRFGLETVLKHRSRLEDAAQRELAEAQAAVNEMLSQIERMYQRMDEVRQEISQAESVGTPEKMAMVVESEGFLIGFRKQIEEKRLRTRELMAIAEEKQEALIHAAREKKILEKLKERRKREYVESRRRIEAKELDDLTMVREVWRRK